MKKELSKKKLASLVIIGLYIAVMLYASVFVPVKAEFAPGDGDVYTEHGYRYIWSIGSAEYESRGIGVSLNVRAWVVQYVFITLIFASLLFHARKHFKD